MDPTGEKILYIKDESMAWRKQVNDKGKVNQLDVGNKKDQHNYKTRTCV